MDKTVHVCTAGKRELPQLKSRAQNLTNFFIVQAGQLVSLCITCTNVTTTELVNRVCVKLDDSDRSLLIQHRSYFRDGTFQQPRLSSCKLKSLPSNPRTFLWLLFSRYFGIFIVYTPITIYNCEYLLIVKYHTLTWSSDGLKGWGKMVIRDGWKCEGLIWVRVFFIWV